MDRSDATPAILPNDVSVARAVARKAKGSFPVLSGRWDCSSDRVGDTYAPTGHLLRRVAHPVLHPPTQHPHKPVRQAHDHEFQARCSKSTDQTAQKSYVSPTTTTRESW